MKTAPIVPAGIDWSGAVPRAPEFDDVYHPLHGADAQAAHVFLAGNGLPQRWRGRERFVVLETGFGLGHNFLAAWRTWRDDPQRCTRLAFVSIDKHPPRREELARAHAGADAPAQALAQALVRTWPALTPNLHPLDFESGRLQLLLAFGDVAQLLPQLQLQADAFFLDGFAPDRNPQMGAPPVLAALGRRAAAGATAATWSVARSLRDGLAGAGFAVERAPGLGGKREITVARHQPRTPRKAQPSGAADGKAKGTPPGAAAPAPTQAVVVGAGVAGAAAAQALRQAGLEVLVLEAAAEPARAASGNPAGLFHGSIGPDDGPHQRLLRAAALLAAREYAPLLAAGTVTGAVDGLLWLDRGAGGVAAMRALLADRGLAPDYVQALDRAAASALAGIALDAPAWHYPLGGWLAPREWVAHALAGCALRCDAAVHALERTDGGWLLRDASGGALAEAPLVVLANAAEAARLARPLLAALGAAEWPLALTRGQVEWDAAPPARPLRPLTGDGYAVTLPDGRVLFGATRAPHAGAASPLPLAGDRLYNLGRAARLLGSAWADGPGLASRAAARVHARDRQPLAGPLHPGAPGLFVLGALGARGITLAPLLARLVAAQALGAPWPMERDLAAAVDPARWLRRAGLAPLSAAPDLLPSR
ncbi:MAG: FAD-dependent 5-carboxymethylaminomethyl-2-thiouridine(34) oxidoreductase MnmC [Pseudomonadota bacterium]